MGTGITDGVGRPRDFLPPRSDRSNEFKKLWREPPTMGKKLVNFITCGCESSTPFCNLQSQAHTNAILVIDLYELLGNPRKKGKFDSIILYFSMWLRIHLYLRYDNVTLSPLLLSARVTNRSLSTYGSSARSDSRQAFFCPNSVVSGWKN